LIYAGIQKRFQILFRCRVEQYAKFLTENIRTHRTYDTGVLKLLEMLHFIDNVLAF
jgi:hypothetical protein